MTEEIFEGNARTQHTPSLFGSLWHAKWMWKMGTRRTHADVPCSRLRWETRAATTTRTNQRKINDFQQNLLSINLSSEAVVDVAAAFTATAHLVQNLN